MTIKPNYADGESGIGVVKDQPRRARVAVWVGGEGVNFFYSNRFAWL